MLADTPRKVLRILYNIRGVPSIAELSRMAVRSPGQIKMALRMLALAGYIKWEPGRHYELRIIQAWESKSGEVDARHAELRMMEHELFPGR